MLQIVILILFATFVAAALFVRFAPVSVARWHVDPVTTPVPNTPNFARLLPDSASRPSPVYGLDIGKLIHEFDRAITSMSRVRRLTDSENGRLVSYEIRSKIMRYPDYLSVRFIELDQDRSTFAVLSRSRFGYGDGGVNRRRLRDLVRALKDFELATATAPTSP